MLCSAQGVDAVKCLQMFEPFDEVIEELRNDPRYVPVSEAIRFLDTSADPLNWEESEALGAPYPICDVLAIEPDPSIVKILRNDSLVKVGVIEAGFYSSEEWESNPRINCRNARWRAFIEDATPEFSENEAHEGVSVECYLDQNIDSRLLCSDFLSAGCTEVAASLMYERDTLYRYRWAAVRYLSIERESLFEFAKQRDVCSDDSNDRAMDPREKKTMQKLLIAALSNRGEIPNNVAGMVRQLDQRTAELGLKVCEKTIRNKVVEAIAISKHN